MTCIDKDRLLIKRPRHIQKCELSVPIYENYVHNQDEEDWDLETDIDVLQPALGTRLPINKFELINQKSTKHYKSDLDFERSFSQSSLSTLNEQKISRGRGQMLKINGKFI